MIGLASMIRSPSTFRMTRSTPCVDGCWGPKFTSISWTSNIVGRSRLTVGRGSLPTANCQLSTASGFGYELLQHALRFFFARHAQGEVVRLPFCDRLRIAFAIPTAGGAVGLGHRGEQFVFERAGFGQLHSVGERLLGIVPRRFSGRLSRVG